MNAHPVRARDIERRARMTDAAVTTANSRRIGRSTLAVLTGFVSVAVFSLATDQVLHVLKVYPPWGQPMWDPGLNLLALTYRTLFAILGGYLTASLAPHAVMRHVVVLAVLGLVMGTLGAIVAISVADLGPIWYPIALAVTAFPSTWLGGVVYKARHGER
jgi:hypothetical protein